jgi:hypothetical protein
MVPFKPSRWGAQLNKKACVSWGDRGSYSCVFPDGSTVSITPIEERGTVTLKSQTFGLLTADNWTVDWTVH